jgi:hypothetical protein
MMWCVYGESWMTEKSYNIRINLISKQIKEIDTLIFLSIREGGFSRILREFCSPFNLIVVLIMGLIF